MAHTTTIIPRKDIIKVFRAQQKDENARLSVQKLTPDSGFLTVGQQEEYKPCKLSRSKQSQAKLMGRSW